jgi:hypothetical protein
MTDHIVSFSGGAGSYCAAKRVIEQHGKENVHLVFCDVLIEDADLYRFIKEAADKLGCQLITLTDGRDPWDVFREKRWIGNTRTAHCSEELKSKPFYKWVQDNFSLDDCVIHLGMDWNEGHRLDRAKKRRPEFTLNAPLLEPPYYEKTDMLNVISGDGIKPPELYSYGFAHNNCGGACVKAGLGQWATLHKVKPDVYAKFEAKEAELLKDIPTTRPFLRKSKGNTQGYLSLSEYRKEYLENNIQLDMFDIGGCGCFSED